MRIKRNRGLLFSDPPVRIISGGGKQAERRFFQGNQHEPSGRDLRMFHPPGQFQHGGWRRIQRMDT